MEDLVAGQEWQQMDVRERQERESTYRQNGLHATPSPPPLYPDRKSVMPYLLVLVV